MDREKGRFSKSAVVDSWLSAVTISIPDAMAISDRWKRLVGAASSLGVDRDEERLGMIFEWMWDVALPLVQPMADEMGFGAEWRAMCVERTKAAADAAAAAAAKAEAPWDAQSTAKGVSEILLFLYDEVCRERFKRDVRREALRITHSAMGAASASTGREWEEVYKEEDVEFVSQERVDAAKAAFREARDRTWATLDPCGLLERLIAA